MTRLKLSDINSEAPVKLTIEIPSRLHRSLIDYAIVLNGGVSEGAPQPSALIGPIIERFIASDREFARQRRSTGNKGKLKE
jgi:hypothetical protein